ncbi:hypothetical protein FJ867_10175 [Mesorhizobium sp. B2-5-3]|nr:hypothetical protein FJ867_10175 [Mesorhizobium sp. B2-5-3]
MRRPVAVAVRNEASPWGISTSVLLHALLTATIISMPMPQLPSRPEEERVILTPRQFEVSTRQSAGDDALAVVRQPKRPYQGARPGGGRCRDFGTIHSQQDRARRVEK